MKSGKDRGIGRDGRSGRNRRDADNRRLIPGPLTPCFATGECR